MELEICFRALFAPQIALLTIWEVEQTFQMFSDITEKAFYHWCLDIIY